MDKKCRVCQNEIKWIQDKHKGLFLFCEKCGFISKPRESFPTPAQELKRYGEHNNFVDDPGYVRFFEKFIKQTLLGYAGQPADGLDFGSGPVPVLAHILENSYNYNMDIYDLYYSPEKVYEGKQYDFITTTEVVEHLSKPMDVFRLFNRLLKPGGILAVMTLLHHNDEERFLKWHYIRDLTHISFYCSSTMEYIARETGLEIIYTDDRRYITFRKKRHICG